MKKQFSMFVLLLSALLLAVTGAGAAPKDGLSVNLSTTQTEFDTTQAVSVTVTISNPTKHSVRILKWFTPAGGVEEPLFAVKRNGETVAYTGAYYKRPAATGSDYITLKAGESVSYTVNLDDYYDLSASGQYEIAYAAAAYTLYSEQGNAFKVRDTLTSEAISLKVDGRAAKGKPTPPPPPPSGGNSFVSCSTTQQTDVVAARTQATTYSTESKGYLSGINSGTPRYGEWFGVYTTARYGTVQTHFSKLADAFTNAGITYDCGCKQPYYAYVYPNQPYKIYLCKYFWLAPLKGTDSKGGTLIHEMSHFNVVASTDDFVYGQTGARQLAIDNPDDAIMNADNHEYFAENNPPLK